MHSQQRTTTVVHRLRPAWLSSTGTASRSKVESSCRRIRRSSRCLIWVGPPAAAPADPVRPGATPPRRGRGGPRRNSLGSERAAGASSYRSSSLKPQSMETSPYLKATPWAWSAARTVLQASADGGAALQGRQRGGHWYNSAHGRGEAVFCTFHYPGPHVRAANGENWMEGRRNGMEGKDSSADGM